MKKFLTFFILGMLGLCIFTGCDNVKDKANENVGKELKFEIYNTADDIVVEKKISTQGEVKAQNVAELYREEYLKQFEDLENLTITIPNAIVTVEGKNATISFDSIIGNAGVGTEGNYIANIAQAILDNIKGIDNVYINVNGDVYESGHIYMELDEPIKTRSKDSK